MAYIKSEILNTNEIFIERLHVRMKPKTQKADVKEYFRKA